MIRTLKNMPYAQAKVITYTDGSMVLVSYTTPIIFVDDTGLVKEITGLYSMTTRRHIGAFMKEFGLTYQDAKECFEKNTILKLW